MFSRTMFSCKRTAGARTEGTDGWLDDVMPNPKAREVTASPAGAAGACAICFDATSARDECLGKLLATERFAGTPVPLGLAAELVERSTGKPVAVADMHALFRLPPGAQDVSMESLVTMVKMDVIRLAFADGLHGVVIYVVVFCGLRLDVRAVRGPT